MRIDAYMQVSQIYQANKTKNAPKTGKAGSRDSLEISSFGNAYQVAKQAASCQRRQSERDSGTDGSRNLFCIN